MAASRFWRVVGIETYAGSDLEISELQLYDNSGRVDASAVLTCTFAPLAGVLANLNDGDTMTTVRWAERDVRAAGFALVWDFGSGITKSCVGVRLGSGPQGTRFLAGASLESFDGSAWTTLGTFNRFPWPGSNAMGPVPGQDYRALVLSDAPACYLRLGETSGTTAVDASGNGRAGAYTAAASSFTASGLVAGGDPAMSLPGTPSSQTGVKFASVPIDTSVNWTVELVIKPTGVPIDSGYATLVQLCANPIGGGGNFPELAMVNIGGGAYRLRVMVSGIQELFLSTQALTYGQRQHVALVYKTAGGGAVSLFVNGVSVGFAAVTYGISTSGASVGHATFLGSPTYYPFPGVIDELAFYQSALGAVQIAAHAAGLDNYNPDPQVFLARKINTDIVVASHITGLPSAEPAAASCSPLAMCRDLEFGGPGRVWGTTKVKGTPNLPTKARVVLLHQRSKVVARETWSNPVTGAFAFEGIDTRQEFITLAEDAAGAYRPVAANKLVPEVVL